MTFFEYLDRRAERRTDLRRLRLKNGVRSGVGNIRDAIGIALIFSFISMMFMLVYKDIPRTNEQLIVYMLGQLSGFVSAVVALHYVSKAGEQADRELAAKRVDNTTKALEAITAANSQPAGTHEDPVKTEIVNQPHDPVPTTPGKKP